jgi:type VI secretion system secreted protein VgrG
LEAGEDIILSAGQNMRTNVGLNKTDTIGGDYTEKITGSKYLTIGFNFMLTVVGSMTEWIKGNKETESKDIKERAKEILVNSSEESVTILGAKNVNNHSGETSKNG